MSESPSTPFTSTEVTVGRYVTVGLWLFSVALLATLALWSAEPHWIA